MRAILAGAGHAHLHVIRHADALRQAGIEPILISPGRFYYSGLTSAVLSGALPADAAQIDIAALARAYGVSHHQAEIAAVDPTASRVTLATGETLAFDILSMNTGSKTDAPAALLDGPNVWPVKPLARLIELRPFLEAAAPGRRCPPLVIAGSGPTAFEIAASLAGLCERLSITSDITLAGPDPHASWAPGGAGKRLASTLQRRSVSLKPGMAAAYDGAVCELDSGERLPCAGLVIATGLKGHVPAGQADLPRGSRDRLIVNSTLNTGQRPNIFAAGDCAAIEGFDRPFAGVFGVRAAPVLLNNIIATQLGRPLKPYRPQSRWLSIMDLGDGTALAMRGRHWWMGRLPLAVKRWLDLRFVAANRV